MIWRRSLLPIAIFLRCALSIRFRPSIAESAFVAWWSVANILTTLAGGFGSQVLFPSLLKLGEPGHYAASAKVVGERIPPRKKGIAVGINTMGGTLGAALAAPLVACRSGGIHTNPH